MVIASGIVQMDDPQSLLAWIRRAPRHNGRQAMAIARLRPEIRPAVDEALRLARVIKAQAMQVGGQGGGVVASWN